MSMLLQAKDIDNIASLFTNVIQSNDGALFLDSSQVWSSLGGELENSTAGARKGLETTSRDPSGYLKNLEHTLSSFRSLTTSLEQEIATVKAQIHLASRMRGINGLPNEMLSIILDYAVLGFADLSTLSRVCSKFRALICSSPRLWARCKLTTSTSASDIDSIVRMSRGRPLVASLELGFTRESHSPRIEEVMRHRSLLGELQITVEDDAEEPSTLRGLQLPLLRDLGLDVICNRFDLLAPRFYESWYIPQLRGLKTNFVPTPFLGKTIISFDFSLTTDSDLVNFTIDRLVGFLAACPFLEHLGVTFMSMDVRLYHEAGDSVVLPNLRSLFLRASQPSSLSLLADFLERLAIDKVTNVTLRIDELKEDVRIMNPMGRKAEYEDVEKWRPAILRRIAKLPHLREVQLLIEEGKTKHSKFDAIWAFNSLLCNLPPTLQRFVSINPLHRLHLYWTTRPIDDSVAALSHLEIYNGTDITIRHFLQLKDWALRGGSGPRIVSVGDCHLIREDELRSSLPACIIEYY